MAIKTIITTCTRDCPNTCGLIATIENGRVIGLKGSADHPLTRGAACNKTARYIQRVYSRERATVPLIRNRARRWQQTDWDSALDLIAEKMKVIRDQDGPEAILYYQGYGERTALKLLNRYFFNLFGGVTTLRGSLCGGTGQAAQDLDLGERISHDPMDHYNSKAIILWGRNPATTNISLVPIIKDIRKRGGRVIVIDPVRNRSCSLADYHIAPAPGRDLYLAMAAAKIILERKGEDLYFLQHCSRGFGQYRAIVDSYTLSELCHLADVRKEDAFCLAETLMTYKPTSILLGWGLHRHKDAHYSIRAIDALAGLSGHIGVTGGGVSGGFEEYGPYDQRWWGDDLNPLRRTLLMPCIGKELLQATDPEIRMAFVSAANPVCMAPNSQLVAKAFAKMEFVVYCGHFLDDTADLADVFLPATTFLEEDDVMASYGHNYVGPVNKAIEPCGQCRSDFHLFSQLAERFPFADRFCRNAEEWLFDICRPIREAGCSMEQLRGAPFRMPQPMVPYLDKKFPTSSGKFHFFTHIDPEFLESHPLSDDTKSYPYTLLSIAPHNHICSERTLNNHPPLPEVLIHPAEAEKNGLEDGARVKLSSSIASIDVQIKTDSSMRKDCLVCERGGWIKAGHGINLLTHDISSTIGLGTPYYDTRVTISAAK